MCTCTCEHTHSHACTHGLICWDVTFVTWLQRAFPGVRGMRGSWAGLGGKMESLSTTQCPTHKATPSPRSHRLSARLFPQLQNWEQKVKTERGGVQVAAPRGRVSSLDACPHCAVHPHAPQGQLDMTRGSLVPTPSRACVHRAAGLARRGELRSSSLAVVSPLAVCR